MTVLNELLATLGAMPPQARAALDAQVAEESKRYRWFPNPGPQSDAYYSKADCLLYGGEPGGGKSQLILGLAFNEHRRSLVMRREYGDLERLIEDALKINGSRSGFNGSPPPRLRIDNEKTIYFRAAHRVGDEQGTMGQGRDLLGIDEATHFAESQVRFLMGWVRTEIQGQRCRTVLATNPPLRPEGLWVTKMFGPWLDPKHPNPARPGELRWVISDEDGNDLWVDGPNDSREIKGKVMRPTSRTYIPASVADNPYYVGTDYERQIDAMPEPYRSLLMGGFRTAFVDVPNQVIPTEWVKMAQARWTPEPPRGVPMCAMGVDASGGGADPLVIASRYDSWFAPMVEVPGKQIPIDRVGKFCAGIVVSHRRDGAVVVVDMGGGYGGPVYEQLVENGIEAVAHKGAEGSVVRTADKKLGFANKRSEVIWRFREALDPGQFGGSAIALPDDPALVADLTAPTFDVGSKGIKVEAKEDVCERLGRSTDRGDAVVMAWSAGRTIANIPGGKWAEHSFGRNRTPQVVTRRPKGQRY